MESRFDFQNLDHLLENNISIEFQFCFLASGIGVWKTRTANNEWSLMANNE